MQNKFDILENLSRLRLHEWKDGGFIEDGIKFYYNRHSTGRGIDCHLIDGDETLHVYYDYDWFSDRYLFNEVGKKHGYLIDDAPWNAIIEEKFAQFARKIEVELARRKQIEENLKFEQSLAEENKIKRFKEKFNKV